MTRDLLLRAAAMVLTTAASITAQADDFNLYYTTDQAAAPTKIEAAGNIDKITFTNGNINIITSSGTTATLPQASTAKLFFATEKTATGVDGIDSAAEGTQADDIIRDTTGRIVATSPGTQDLPSGIYISKGKKIIIR